MHKLNQKGIGALAAILILFFVGTIGVAGWKVWDAKTSNTPSTKQASTPTNNTTQTEDKKAPEPEKVATGTVIVSGGSEFGIMLFNDNKQAIYIWELEESAKAECYGDCAFLWPPVLTDEAPRATGAVNASLLGTTQRTDGNTQVTYNGHPLYYYAHEGPGEVKCHNFKTHGGLWWVIQPNGNKAA